MNTEQCFQCGGGIGAEDGYMPPARLTIREPGRTTSINFCGMLCVATYAANTVGRKSLDEASAKVKGGNGNDEAD